MALTGSTHGTVTAAMNSADEIVLDHFGAWDLGDRLGLPGDGAVVDAPVESPAGRATPATVDYDDNRAGRDD
eukprot:3480552-Pyramimonas_sp.AAC.1